MLALLVFCSVIENVGEECRNRILGNIFSINNVSISDFSIRDEYVVFRLFSDGVFYQYFFLIEREDGCIFQIFSNDNIIQYFILISDYFEGCSNVSFALFMNLIDKGNEYEVYRRLHLFL